MKYSPKEMNEVIKQNNFNFKKKFGQNFIIDENIINNIVNKANIDKDTLVIEIGPGAGSLTYKMGQSAKNILAYEIDTSLKEILESNLKEFDNIEIIYEDFLKRNILDDLKKYKYNKLYVVANLPYYITTPIINKIINENIMVDKIVIMVQKEVGDRFKAKVGSKDYSSLSIFLDYYFDVEKLLDVSRNVFMPKPNVDSIVVEFRKKSNKYDVNDEKHFFKLIRDSFKQNRKTLKNNLKEYDFDIILNVLKKYGFDINVRAEQLNIDIFIAISNNLTNK